MNAPLPTALHAADTAAPARLREIPYNYTSLSDREIVLRLLGERDRKSTRLNSSHSQQSRMPSSA